MPDTILNAFGNITEVNLGDTSQLLALQKALLEEQAEIIEGHASVASEKADLAEAAAANAEQSASFAEEFSGPVYASQAAGEAATGVGQFFRVWNGDTPRTYTRYERTAGGSEVAEPLATSAALASTAGTEMVGLPYGGTARDLTNFITPEMRNAAPNSDDEVDDFQFVQEAIDIAAANRIELKLLRDYNIHKPAGLNRGLRAYLTALGPIAFVGHQSALKPKLNFLNGDGGNVNDDATRYNGFWFVRSGGWSATPLLWSFKCHNMAWAGNVNYLGGAGFDPFHKPFNGVDLNVWFDLDFQTVDILSWRGEMFYGVGGAQNMSTALELPHIPVAKIRDVRCIESGLNLTNFGGLQIIDVDGLYLSKGQMGENLHSAGGSYKNVLAEDVNGGVFTAGPYPDFALPNVFWGKLPRDGSAPMLTFEGTINRSSAEVRFGPNVHFDIDATDASVGIFPMGRVSNWKGRLRSTLDQSDGLVALTAFPGNSFDTEAPATSDYIPPHTTAQASFAGDQMTVTSLTSRTYDTVNGPLICAAVGNNVAAGTSGGRTALPPGMRIVDGPADGGPGVYTVDPPVSAPIATQTVTIGQLTEPLSDVDVDITLCRTANAVANNRWFDSAVQGNGPVDPDSVRFTVRGNGVVRSTGWGFSTTPTEVGNIPFIDEAAMQRPDGMGTGLFGQWLPITESGTYYLSRNRAFFTFGAVDLTITLGDTLPAVAGNNGAYAGKTYADGFIVRIVNAGGGKLLFPVNANQNLGGSTLELPVGGHLDVMFDSTRGGWVLPAAAPKSAPIALGGGESYAACSNNTLGVGSAGIELHGYFDYGDDSIWGMYVGGDGKLALTNKTGDVVISSDGNNTITFALTDWAEQLTYQYGNLGIGTANPTAKLDVVGNTIRLRNAKTPATAAAEGNAGDICWDANYIYVCVADDTWKRAALASW